MIATYLALITLLDDCVGRILATLRATETLDDTLVVLVSDHGDQLGEHGMAGKMGNLYEASIRVPLVIRLPGAAHAGADRGQLAEMVDLFPTICDLPHPGGPQALAGHSLAPVVADVAAEHRRIVHAMLLEGQMARTESLKLNFHADERGELYDLAADPDEMVNRYDEPAYRDRRHELLAEITRFLIRSAGRARQERVFRLITRHMARHMGHPIIDCDVHVYPRDPEELQKYLPLPWKHWYRGESRPFYQDKPPLHYLHRNVRLTTQPMENPDDPAHLAALLRSIEAQGADVLQRLPPLRLRRAHRDRPPPPRRDAPPRIPRQRRPPLRPAACRARHRHRPGIRLTAGIRHRARVRIFLLGAFPFRLRFEHRHGRRPVDTPFWRPSFPPALVTGGAQ